MQVFQSQFAILVEDHRLAANAMSKFETQKNQAAEHAD